MEYKVMHGRKLNEKSEICIDDEYLDLVDFDDKVVGFELRSIIYNRNQKNFRVINAFIINSIGQIWVPRRAPHKKFLPMQLNSSVAGHVKSGETYEQALERELHEELSVNLEDVRWKTLGYLSPFKDMVGAFMKVFEIYADFQPTINHEEYINATWMSPKQIWDLEKHDLDSIRDFPKLINKYYSPNFQLK